MNEPFPDAPPGSYVCDEGWLIIDDEAWTEDEWAHRNRWLIGRPTKYTDERHRRDRERKRQKRMTA